MKNCGFIAAWVWVAELTLRITAELISGQLETFHLTSSPFFVLAEKDHLMLRFRREVAAKVAELGWVVAVDKENAQNDSAQPKADETLTHRQTRRAGCYRDLPA